MTSTLEAICQAVDARRDEIVAALMEVVRIPTQTPPGENYDRIVEHLLPHFRALGFDARRYDLPDETFEERCRRHYPEMTGVRANLLARLPRTGKPGMLWYCHLDTIPAGDRAQWSVEPFEPIVRDGYVWGRGTADSKGGAIAILSAFRVLHALGIPPEVSPIVALTTDEEIGPYTGLMHMADTGVFAGCQWFHSCDGMANSVGIGSLGAFTWTVRVRGRSVHSGSAFLGLNPIEHSVALLDELVKIKGDVEARRSRLTLSPEVVEATGRAHIGPLLNINIAHAGVKHNVVPPEFVVEGDRRFIPEEDEAECVREIERAIDRARARDAQLDCALTVKPFYTAFANDPNDPWVQRVCRLASTVRGTPIVAAGISGSTDVAHTVKVTGMQVAINGLARHAETRNHGIDERCRIDDLLSVTKTVAALAAQAF